MATKTGIDQYVDLSNARTRYIEAGQGEKHLLLLHGIGLTSSADNFQLVMDDLASDFHVYALDLLGYGKGTRTIEAGPTFDLTVDHLREFMDAKGIEKASIVGHSAGGWVAGLLAYESPQRFEKLVLLCTAGMNAEISPGTANQRLPADKEQAAENLKRLVPDQSKLTEDQVQAILASQMEVAGQPGALHSLDSILQQMSTLEVRRRYLLHRRLPRITVPTLVIWGKCDWMDPYPTWTEEYERLGGDMSKSTKPWTIPGAQYLLLPTGHFPHWEDPELLVKVLTEFLKD